MPESTVTRRRAFRFSLRTLLVVVGFASLLCVVASLAIDRYDRWERQERARRQLEQTIDLWDFPQSIEEAR